MRSLRPFGALLLASSLLITSPVLAADPTPEDIAQARSLGEQGQAALDAKHFTEAERLFSAATRLYPVAPTLSLGYARALAAQGKLIAARETYNHIVRDGTPANAPTAFKAAVDAAHTEGDALVSRVANVTISVIGPASPQVTVDGAPLPVAGLGLPRPIDPGEHKISVTAEGYKPAEQAFTVAEGTSVEQKVSLVKNPVIVTPPPVPTVQPQPEPPPQLPPDQPDQPKSSRKTIGYVVGGVGAAGVVVGSIAGIIAIGKHSDLSTACGSGKCDPSQKNAVESYNTVGAVSTVGFIVGAVGLGVGAALIFTAPKDPKAAFVSPYVGLGSAGLTGRF